MRTIRSGTIHASLVSVALAILFFPSVSHARPKLHLLADLNFPVFSFEMTGFSGNSFDIAVDVEREEIGGNIVIPSKFASVRRLRTAPRTLRGNAKKIVQRVLRKIKAESSVIVGTGIAANGDHVCGDFPAICARTGVHGPDTAAEDCHPAYLESAAAFESIKRVLRRIGPEMEYVEWDGHDYTAFEPLPRSKHRRSIVHEFERHGRVGLRYHEIDALEDVVFKQRSCFLELLRDADGRSSLGGSCEDSDLDGARNHYYSEVRALEPPDAARLEGILREIYATSASDRQCPEGDVVRRSRVNSLHEWSITLGSSPRTYHFPRARNCNWLSSDDGLAAIVHQFFAMGPERS